MTNITILLTIIMVCLSSFNFIYTYNETNKLTKKVQNIQNTVVLNKSNCTNKTAIFDDSLNNVSFTDNNSNSIELNKTNSEINKNNNNIINNTYNTENNDLNELLEVDKETEQILAKIEHKEASKVIKNIDLEKVVKSLK